MNGDKYEGEWSDTNKDGHGRSHTDSLRGEFVVDPVAHREVGAMAWGEGSGVERAG